MQPWAVVEGNLGTPQPDRLAAADRGIWEARGEPQYYPSSKVMCSVALNRAAELPEIRCNSGLQASWAAAAEGIKADILEHGFVLRYKTDETDAGLSGREGTFLICSFRLRVL